MPKEIDDKFDRWEKIVERGSKLLLKIGTAIVGVIIGLFVALEQLDYHLFDGDEAPAPAPEIASVDSVYEPDFYDEPQEAEALEENNAAPVMTKGNPVQQIQQVELEPIEIEVDNYDMPDVDTAPETLNTGGWYEAPDTLVMDTAQLDTNVYELDTL